MSTTPFLLILFCLLVKCKRKSTNRSQKGRLSSSGPGQIDLNSLSLNVLIRKVGRRHPPSGVLSRLKQFMYGKGSFCTKHQGHCFFRLMGRESGVGSTAAFPPSRGSICLVWRAGFLSQLLSCGLYRGRRDFPALLQLIIAVGFCRGWRACLHWLSADYSRLLESEASGAYQSWPEEVACKLHLYTKSSLQCPWAFAA